MIKITIGIIVLTFGIVLCRLEICRAEQIMTPGEQVSYSVASWYGQNFHGRQTASGQIFDMHSFTCAHKTYPFGSWLKITNLLNDKTTYCVVNDRGPFNALRDLDLSYAAAKVIDMIAIGICAVKVEYLGMNHKYIEAVREIFKDRH